MQNLFNSWNTPFGKFSKLVAKWAQGFLCGIDTIWEPNNLALDRELVVDHWIALRFHNWNTKESCWSSILESSTHIPHKNKILLGDFNLVLDQKKKKGGSIVRDLIGNYGIYHSLLESSSQ